MTEVEILKRSLAMAYERIDENNKDFADQIARAREENERLRFRLSNILQASNELRVVVGFTEWDEWMLTSPDEVIERCIPIVKALKAAAASTPRKKGSRK